MAAPVPPLAPKPPSRGLPWSRAVIIRSATAQLAAASVSLMVRPMPVVSRSPSRWNGAKIPYSLGLRDARALVGHIEPHDLVRTVGSRPDQDDAVGGVTQGVVDQVREHPVEQSRAGCHRWKSRRQVDLDPVPGVAGEPGDDRGDAEGELHRLRAHGDGCGLQPGRVEQVGDDGVEPVGRVDQKTGSAIRLRRAEIRRLHRSRGWGLRPSSVGWESHGTRSEGALA